MTSTPPLQLSFQYLPKGQSTYSEFSPQLLSMAFVLVGGPPVQCDQMAILFCNLLTFVSLKICPVAERYKNLPKQVKMFAKCQTKISQSGEISTNLVTLQSCPFVFLWEIVSWRVGSNFDSVTPSAESIFLHFRFHLKPVRRDLCCRRNSSRHDDEIEILKSAFKPRSRVWLINSITTPIASTISLYYNAYKRSGSPV